jgi:hypothetical protein
MNPEWKPSHDVQIFDALYRLAVRAREYCLQNETDIRCVVRFGRRLFYSISKKINEPSLRK